MNDRIKELAVKAGANWNHGDFNMGSSVEFQEDDLEKSAELFVKECAKVCNSRAGNSDYNTGRMHFFSDIKEHFGVE